MKSIKVEYTYRLDPREFFIILDRSGLTPIKIMECIKKLTEGIIAPEFEAAFDRKKTIVEGARTRIQRTRILERDGYTCTYCGKSGLPLEVDHIYPVSKGGGSHDDNLTTACKPCNRDKGSKTLEQWRGSNV